MAIPTASPAAALRAGDRIRLVAPASPFDRRRYSRGLDALRGLGFEPVVERAEFSRTGFLAGPDADRASRLQRALAEPDTRAVWCIRGGYGSARLLEQLDLAAARRSRKLLIGFSDISALLWRISAGRGPVSLHGPVITQLADLPGGQRAWLRRLLTARAPLGRAPLGRLRRLVPGRVEGRLVGGNLSILASLAGTPHQPDLGGAILFIEEVGEPAYRLDRLWTQLRQAGVLARVRGLILGQLEGCTPAGRAADGAAAVLERAAIGLGVPAVAGAAIGHGRRNAALPIGVLARLDADRPGLELLGPALR